MEKVRVEARSIKAREAYAESLLSFSNIIQVTAILLVPAIPICLFIGSHLNSGALTWHYIREYGQAILLIYAVLIPIALLVSRVSHNRALNILDTIAESPTK